MSNIKEKFDKVTVQLFRTDFEKAIKDLEERYCCNISLGTLRYNNNEVRGKMIAQKGVKKETLKNSDFNVGDKVRILHKKADPKTFFRVIKINKKSIKVRNIDNLFDIWKVSSSLLELV
jgi:hypothetical protein